MKIENQMLNEGNNKLGKQDCDNSEIDKLTQVYNQKDAERHICDVLETNHASGVSALILLDLDHFKEIIDMYGYVVGDIVLSNIASILKEKFDEDSIVGRLENNEFIIFIHNIHKEPEAARQILNNRFNQLLHQMRSFTFGDYSSHVSASVGIRLIQDVTTAFITLYHDADTALDEAKKSGGDQFLFYQRENKE